MSKHTWSTKGKDKGASSLRSLPFVQSILRNKGRQHSEEERRDNTRTLEEQSKDPENNLNTKTESSKQTDQPSIESNDSSINSEGKNHDTKSDTSLNDYPRKMAQNTPSKPMPFKESFKNVFKKDRSSKNSGKSLRFGPDVVENEGKTPRRRESQACEYEADDEGFCIDGFQDDESIDDFTDEEDDTFSEEDEANEPDITCTSEPIQMVQPRVINESKVIPKYQRIAQEIMSTEKTYVDRLSLIYTSGNEFLDSCLLSKEEYEQIFKNLPELYYYHKEKFLPKISERIEKWETEPRIGDIMKTFSPFLKNYTPFVKNIETSRKLLHQHKKNSPKFCSAVQKIESSNQAGRITLSDYMTEPMTRLLRYKLLLGEYLRKLPEGCKDREDTEAALDITSEAAKYVNESIRAEDNMARLKQIQESLGPGYSIVDPSRTFLKEGRVAMVDPVKGRHLERHIFLFNNLILVCQPQIMGMKYKIHKKIPMKQMKLEKDEDNHHFTVLSRKVVAEFYGSTPRETDEWVKAIDNALAKFQKEHVSEEPEIEATVQDELGYRAPFLARRDSSIDCNLCGEHFGTIVRTKNHCFACGKLYCNRCSCRSVRLAYADWQTKRVCDRCYNSLRDDAVCKSIESLTEDEWIWGELTPTKSKTKSIKNLLSRSRKTLPAATRDS